MRFQASTFQEAIEKVKALRMERPDDCYRLEHVAGQVWEITAEQHIERENPSRQELVDAIDGLHRAFDRLIKELHKRGDF